MSEANGSGRIPSVRNSENFDADFHNAEENFQLRTRLKAS
jgi:hypothetical protein